MEDHTRLACLLGFDFRWNRPTRLGCMTIIPWYCMGRTVPPTSYHRTYHHNYYYSSYVIEDAWMLPRMLWTAVEKWVALLPYHLVSDSFSGREAGSVRVSQSVSSPLGRILTLNSGSGETSPKDSWPMIGHGKRGDGGPEALLVSSELIYTIYPVRTECPVLNRPESASSAWQ